MNISMYCIYCHKKIFIITGGASEIINDPGHGKGYYLCDDCYNEGKRIPEKGLFSCITREDEVKKGFKWM